jgi:hypothetical protein
MPAAAVRRRVVLYIGGFDPRGPAHYHRLYRDNAQQQATVSGVGITVGARRRRSPHSAAWTVGYQDGADRPPVQTEIEFLRWDDIVRAQWPRNLASLWADMLRCTWLYFRAGAMARMGKLDWRPWSLMWFPALLSVLMLVGLPLLDWGLWVLGARAALAPGWVLAAIMLMDAAALVFAALVVRRVQGPWLMRTFVFSARQAGQEVAGLEARIDAFARLLCERCAAGEVDELLVVGHSLGTMLAPAVLARALRIDPDLPRRGPRLSLLTLGQCSPMLSTLPGAREFRQELALLARTEELDWIDFTAPSDYCSFALVDPVAAAGKELVALADRPKLLSAKFMTLFSPERYAALRKDGLRLHFQYIMAGERPGPYDYFAITAGPLTLGARYAQQPSVRNFRRR